MEASGLTSIVLNTLPYILEQIKSRARLTDEQLEIAATQLQNGPWVAEHRDETVKICDILDSSYRLSETAKKAYLVALELNPHLFPAIILKTYDQEFRVPIGKVYVLGRFLVPGCRAREFELRIPERIKESSARTAYSAALNAFGKYFSTGKAEIIPDIFNYLLETSYRYEVFSLQKECIKFIFESTLSKAIFLHERSCLGSQIEFYKEIKADPKFQEFLKEVTPPSNELLDLIRLGITFVPWGVKISKKKSSSPEGLAILGKLNAQKEIERIEIEAPNMGDNEFVALSKVLPKLKYLRVTDCELTEIPHLWQQSLQDLRVNNCHELKAIKLAAVKKVLCWHSPKVALFEVPTVEHFHLQDSLHLVDLDLPAGKLVVAWNNPALKNFKALSAEYVNLSDCPIEMFEVSSPLKELRLMNVALKTLMLNIPNMRDYRVFNCDKITAVFALSSAHGDFRNNPNLQEIVSGAKRLHVNNCATLEKVEANLAESAEIHISPSLKIVKALAAKELKVPNNPGLVTEVPKECIISESYR